VAELELKGITKSYGGVSALQDASLVCEAGEVHGLIGENGAGKSTLVKILAGAVDRDAGTITLGGHELVGGGSRASMAAGIGAVFQELSLMPDLTVAQNIFFGREPLDALRGTTARRLRLDAYRLFDRLGVEVADPDRPVRELPLAQRQMVEIAKVLGRDPRVVIFDEATAALGRAHADWLLRHCAQLAAEGKVVIFISHHLREIRGVSDRITVFRNGRDVASRIRAAADTDELVALMVGRRVGQLFPPRVVPVGAEVTLEGRQLVAGSRLRGVDLAVHRGEILGIGGLTGQGQEELCRLIFGVRTGTGQLLLDGQPLVVANPSQALQRGIALVPEDRATQGLLMPKSVAVNVSLAVLARLSRLGIIDRGAERREVNSAISQLVIKTPAVDTPVQRLSGGNQQKVVLAKLLATRPRVLVLLDSTRGVDVATKAEIYQLVRDLCTGGSSVLLYSTDNDELIHLADRVIVMRRGQIEAELAGPSLTEGNLIRASMGEPIAVPVTTPAAVEPVSGAADSAAVPTDDGRTWSHQ
jgi:ribose transport system ATP-binding protein